MIQRIMKRQFIQFMKNYNIDSNQEYKYGITTDIESIKAQRGLTENTIKFISKLSKYFKDVSQE